MSAHNDFLKFIMDLDSLRKSNSLNQDGLTRLLTVTEASTETAQGASPSAQDTSGGEAPNATEAANTPSNR
jgi:hypothetical protein